MVGVVFGCAAGCDLLGSDERSSGKRIVEGGPSVDGPPSFFTDTPRFCTAWKKINKTWEKD
jgi:hypothetical protein